MANISVSHNFATNAATVWASVGNAGSVADWIPALASSHLEGDIRHVRFADGEPARERIVAHDDATRSYTYSYIDGPLPLEEYVSTVTVVEVGESASTVEWTARFSAGSPDVEEALATSISEIYSAALTELDEQLAR